MKSFMYKKFDFEIGHLVKSPCQACETRGDFPGCARTCSTLRNIQVILAESISCTRHYATLESSALSQEGWRK